MAHKTPMPAALTAAGLLRPSRSTTRRAEVAALVEGSSGRGAQRIGQLWALTGHEPARDNRAVGEERIPTFCPLCVSRCGALATVEDGKFVALHPDPSHPTGKAICLKGKAAPEILDHPSRLLHPLR